MKLKALARHMWGDFRIHPLLSLCLLIGALFVEVAFRVTGLFIYYFLPIVGVSVTILSLVHLVRRFRSLDELTQLRLILFNAERWATIPVTIFVGHSLIVLANGANDFTAPVEQRVEIVSISTFEVEFNRSLSISLAELKLQDSASRGYVLLHHFEKNSLWGGEIGIAQVHAGTLGFPWISGIARDEEYYLRLVLQQSPRSSAAWKNLVIYYKNLKRWDDAVNALYGYLDVYPYAYRFAGIIAGQMVANSGPLDQAIPLLEYAVGIGHDYDDYQMLGVAYQWKGENQKAVKVFEGALRLAAPHDWEVYFHLGETYSLLGRGKDAIAMYRKVLEIRPDFPEIEKLLQAAIASVQSSG